MITMKPKIQSTTSTRALRSKIGPIKAYLFKTSYVISPITPSDLKHSMRVPIRDSGDSSYRLSTYPPFDEGTSA